MTEVPGAVRERRQLGRALQLAGGVLRLQAVPEAALQGVGEVGLDDGAEVRRSAIGGLDVVTLGALDDLPKALRAVGR